MMKCYLRQLLFGLLLHSKLQEVSFMNNLGLLRRRLTSTCISAQILGCKKKREPHACGLHGCISNRLILHNCQNKKTSDMTKVNVVHLCAGYTISLKKGVLDEFPVLHS